MKNKKVILLITGILFLLLLIGSLLGAFLRLINELKYSLAYFLPYWLVNPIFFIFTILLIYIGYTSLWPWIKTIKLPNKYFKTNKNPSLPKSKLQAAKQTIESIDQLLLRIQDKVEREALKYQRDRVNQELARGDLVVVFFGTGSSGKTSLIRALLNEIIGEVGAEMGSTKTSKSYRLRLKGLERGIKLIDTPGIFEAGKAGKSREDYSKSWASRADLMIFVVDGDLKASEFETINNAKSLGKKLILVLNKCDLRGEKEVEKLLYLLRGRCRGNISSANIISSSASPQSIPRPGKKPIQPPPEIEDLLILLARTLHEDGEELIADNILLQCRNLSNTGRNILNKQRKEQAKSIIDRFSWISSGVVLANPLPGIDLLGTAAVNAQMVFEIAKVYGIELTKERSQELALSVARTLAGLGIIKGGVNLISTALTINLPTIIIGRAIQSVAAAWLTRISGASFVTYFQQDQDWGDGGIQEVVRKHYDLNRRAKSLNNFLEIAFRKIVEPLQERHQRQLPPRQKLQEEEEAFDHPLDQEW